MGPTATDERKRERSGPRNLAWLMTSLLIVGVSPDHPLIQVARQYLEDQQQEDGRWASEDGPDWDLHSTLEAVRALCI